MNIRYCSQAFRNLAEREQQGENRLDCNHSAVPSVLARITATVHVAVECRLPTPTS